MWFNHPWGYGYGYGMMGGFGWLFMILFLVVIVAVLIGLFRYLGSGHPMGPMQGRTALDILNERYARGEIDRDEYQQKRGDLGS